MAYLNRLLQPYRSPDARRAAWQLGSTGMLFVVGWSLMLASLTLSYWLTLLLALPTAGLLIRLFIFQHDCGHGSFFRSQRVNDAIGFWLGVLTLVPYVYWRKTHAIHHATSGNLDQRMFGDIDTLTVREYLAMSAWERVKYRVYRNAAVLLVVGPVYQFVIKHRYPGDIPPSWKREWASVHRTNLALAGAVILVAWLVGWRNFALVQLPIVVFSGSLGVWLFYIQHQFEDTYWARNAKWDFVAAGLKGSSFYDLPRVLHWFTGNIGYHHIHHVNSRIPNYRLRDCMRDLPEFGHVTHLTLRQSLRCLGLTLWDEEEGRLVGFRHLKRLRAPPSEVSPPPLP